MRVDMVHSINTEHLNTEHSESIFACSICARTIKRDFPMSNLSLHGQCDCYYDTLTNLPNERLLTDLIQDLINQGAGEHLAVLVINLDQFHCVNDNLGYEIGNRLLAAAAQRLREYLPTTYAIAHLHTNEFAILLENIQLLDVAFIMADFLRQKLVLPFTIDQQTIFITASIGITWGKFGYTLPHEFLHDACTAMHRAKALGQDRCEIFDISARLEAAERLRLEAELRLALINQELEVYYQPIVSLRTSAIIGFEALLRWRHPLRGMISPLEFIPLAEETKLIHAIGAWVLRQAFEQLHEWHQQFPMLSDLSVSVNLSVHQFAQANLLEQIQKILQETQVNPTCIKLEITESSIMQNPSAASSVLHCLKDLGIQIYMDDFGTGYSSLSQLYNFPLDALKIDRSFINRIDAEAKPLEIVQIITRLAGNLGMSVVAEGVENMDQLFLLKDMGCDYAQGYLISEPVDRQSAEALLLQNHACHDEQVMAS
jgi:diguanylate cyclase (GGDEF)-like protein